MKWNAIINRILIGNKPFIMYGKSSMLVRTTYKLRKNGPAAKTKAWGGHSPGKYRSDTMSKETRYHSKVIIVSKESSWHKKYM